MQAHQPPHLHSQDGEDEEEEHDHDADVAHGCQAQREALEDELHSGGARQRTQRLDGAQHAQRLQQQALIMSNRGRSRRT
jgi:hypothetical protein